MTSNWFFANFSCPLNVNDVFMKFIKRIFNFICREEGRYFSNFLSEAVVAKNNSLDFIPLTMKL